MKNAHKILKIMDNIILQKCSICNKYTGLSLIKVLESDISFKIGRVNVHDFFKFYCRTPPLFPNLKIFKGGNNGGLQQSKRRKIMDFKKE